MSHANVTPRESECICAPVEKLVVYGTGRTNRNKEPGNIEYLKMQHSFTAEFQLSDSSRKDAIVNKFIEKFDFLFFQSGMWLSSEIKGEEKVRKALGDSRKLQNPSRSSRSLEKNDFGLGRKLVVYGAGHQGLTQEPGNTEYTRMLQTYKAKYNRSEKPQQAAIVHKFIEKFDFESKGRIMEIEQAKFKVVNAIADLREYTANANNVSERNQQAALPLKKKSHYLHMFLVKDTPYIEELAFHFYAMRKPEDNKPGKLEPLPQPNFSFLPPSDDAVKWSYDERSRVLTANFSEVDEITEKHKRLLGQFMERDDITVVCEGLFGLMKNEEEFLESVERAFGDDPYHRFRQFDRVEEDGHVSYNEHDGYISMKVSDFLSYLAILRDPATGDRLFSYVDATGSQQTIADALNVVYYMIDVDMPKFLHQLDEEYKQNFKMKEILPGGAWCMMNHVCEWKCK
jgi:hypothetical protein